MMMMRNPTRKKRCSSSFCIVPDDATVPNDDSEFELHRQWHPVELARLEMD
jgi:hypothetical protein